MGNYLSLILTENVVVPRDWPGSRDRTKGVKIPPDLEVLLLLTLTRGEKVRHHYLLLRA